MTFTNISDLQITLTVINDVILNLYFLSFNEPAVCFLKQVSYEAST